MADERKRRPRPGQQPTYGDAPETETGGWVDPATELSPAEIHARHVRQRLEGGRKPDQGAYRQAAEQWRRLPGSASVSAADLGELPPAADTNDAGDGSSAPDGPQESAR